MDKALHGAPYGKRRGAVAVLLCLALALLPLAGCDSGGEDKKTGPEPMDYGPLVTGGLQVVASVGTARLSVDPATGEFIAEDGKGNATRSNPVDRADDKKARDIWKTNLNAQLILTYSSQDGRISQQVNSFTGCVRKDGLKVHRTEDGFIAEYTFPKEKFVIPVRIALQEDGFTATVLADRISTEGAELLLTGIDLLPFLGAANLDKTGYMLVPDGTGALVNLNNGKAVTGFYQASVYGDDRTIPPEQRFAFQKTASLPVFGIQTQESGLVAIITKGDAVAQINAHVSGVRTSYNFLYAAFILRARDSFTIVDRTGKARDNPVLDRSDLSCTEFQVAYRFLGAAEGGYVRMAEVYREYLSSTWGEADGSRTPEGTPGLYLDFYGAVMKTKPVVGIPLETLVPLSPFREVAEALRSLKTKGVDRFVVRMKNATVDDTKMEAPRNPAPIARLGGSKGYAELQAEAGQENVYLAVDPTDVRSNGWIFRTLSTTSATIMGLPAYQQRYDLTSGRRDESDRWYLLSPQVASDLFARYALRAVRSDTTRRIAVDGFGSGLYSDFGKAAVDREEAMEAFAKSLSDARAAGAHLLLEGAGAYAAASAERLTDVPSTNSGYAIFDAEVPFVQLVYHGLVEYAGEPINLSSNPRRAFLKAIESWSALHYAFITKEPSELRETELQWLYGSDWSAWSEDVAADYARFREMAEATGGSRIVGHEILSADFSKVTYANGTAVLVNCSRSEKFDGGLAVPSMDFRIVR